MCIWRFAPISINVTKILVVCFLATSVMVGCGKESTREGEKDDLRIISLAPNATEILFALGLEDHIAGISSQCNFPPQTSKIEKVGTFSNPNIEKILSLKPDIVFAVGLEQLPAVENLRRLKICTYLVDPSNIEELFEHIKHIGAITNRTVEAMRLVDEMKTRIERIDGEVKNVPLQKRPRVYIEIWHDPLMTGGRGSFLDELITYAGGVNIAGDARRPYSRFSPELVIERNPDCIVLAYMGNFEPIELVAKRLGWDQIQAVKNKKVYGDINPDWLLRAGPRLVDGLEVLYERFYERGNAPDDN